MKLLYPSWLFFKDAILLDKLTNKSHVNENLYNYLNLLSGKTKPSVFAYSFQRNNIYPVQVHVYTDTYKGTIHVNSSHGK